MMTAQDYKIAILGPGAIGGFLAAVFAKHDIPVTLIGTQKHVTEIGVNGLCIKNYFTEDFQFQPRVISQLDFTPDVLFITTKFTHLDSALTAISPQLVTQALVIPLLNGLEHFPVIRNKLGEGVVAGMIGGIEANKTNHIITVAAKHLELMLGTDDEGLRARLSQFTTLLNTLGLKATLYGSEQEAIWQKLGRLSVVAGVTAASRQSLGFVKTDGQWQMLLDDAIQEVVSIAHAEGASLAYETVKEKIYAMPDTLTTSLQRDVMSNRPSEADAILGAVIRLAKQHQLPCAALETLFNRIQQP